MQGNLWNGDPDFLVCGPDTRASIWPPARAMPDRAGWRLDVGRGFEMEARTYALLVHLSGGDVILGDALLR